MKISYYILPSFYVSDEGCTQGKSTFLGEIKMRSSCATIVLMHMQQISFHFTTSINYLLHDNQCVYSNKSSKFSCTHCPCRDQKQYSFSLNGTERKVFILQHIQVRKHLVFVDSQCYFPFCTAPVH